MVNRSDCHMFFLFFCFSRENGQNTKIRDENGCRRLLGAQSINTESFFKLQLQRSLSLVFFIYSYPVHIFAIYYFSGLYLQLLKLLHNCEDHFHFYSLSAVHSYDLYHTHIMSFSSYNRYKLNSHLSCFQ